MWYRGGREEGRGRRRSERREGGDEREGGGEQQHMAEKGPKRMSTMVHGEGGCHGCHECRQSPRIQAVGPKNPCRAPPVDGEIRCTLTCAMGRKAVRDLRLASPWRYHGRRKRPRMIPNARARSPTCHRPSFKPITAPPSPSCSPGRRKDSLW